jgi:hypothetical protein
LEGFERVFGYYRAEEVPRRCSSWCVIECHSLIYLCIALTLLSVTVTVTQTLCAPKGVALAGVGGFCELSLALMHVRTIGFGYHHIFVLNPNYFNKSENLILGTPGARFRPWMGLGWHLLCRFKMGFQCSPFNG